MRARKTLTLLAVAVLALAGPLASGAAAAPDREDALQIFNRDVYEVVGASLRNPDADTEPEKNIYSVFGAALQSGTGEFITWGDWSRATAASTARAIGGPDGPRTDVRIHLDRLVPGAVYSVFWGTLDPDSEHPLCPGVERTRPLDALHPERQEPAPNAFVAGLDGAAEFRGRVNADLLAARQVFLSIVYHATGQTYYPFPNIGEQVTQGEECRSSYGQDSMRHLLILQKW